MLRNEILKLKTEKVECDLNSQFILQENAKIIFQQAIYCLHLRALQNQKLEYSQPLYQIPFIHDRGHHEILMLNEILSSMAICEGIDFIWKPFWISQNSDSFLFEIKDYEDSYMLYEFNNSSNVFLQSSYDAVEKYFSKEAEFYTNLKDKNITLEEIQDFTSTLEETLDFEIIKDAYFNACYRLGYEVHSTYEKYAIYTNNMIFMQKVRNCTEIMRNINIQRKKQESKGKVKVINK